MAEINKEDRKVYHVAEDFEYIHDYHQYFTVKSSKALGSLDDFSREYVESLHGRGIVMCLADLLLAWLVYGDATRHCPTYDIYLRTAIGAFAIWNGESSRDKIEDFYMAPDGSFPRRSSDSGGGGVTLATITRPDSTVSVFDHPAFDRTTYENAKVERSIVVWEEHPFLLQHRATWACILASSN